MTNYVLRRLPQLVLVLFGVTVVSFGLMFLSGDPAELWLGPAAEVMTAEQISEWRENMGFNRPWYVQYLDYASNAVRGDFGTSFRHGRSAMALIVERMPATVQLAALALSLSVVLGIPLGVLAAVKRNTPIDGVAMLFALLGQSMPSFWIGIMLMLFFGVRLRLLPISGRGGFEHLILPAATLAFFYLAQNARVMRSSMLEVLGLDYIRTARAKGLAHRAVVYRHALKNALIPVITLIGLQVGAMLGGTVIIETVFAWPGVGRLVVTSIGAKDFPVVQAGVVVLASSFVIANTIVDLTYALIDPRIRYS